MSASASGGGGAAAPPPGEPPEDEENEVQRNIRLKVCAYCKKPGAVNKCEACLQRTYCDKKCQKKDWKTVHREQCKKLQQVFFPPPAGWRERADGGGGERDGGDGGAAAAAGGGEGSGVGDDGEDDNLCPICLDNKDDAWADGASPLCMCNACGQLYCGACSADGLFSKSPNCPTCRAPFGVSDEENFKRCWKLVHDRSPGRHTKYAQSYLGGCYFNGDGVKQDDAEAFKWFKRAADNGNGAAMGLTGIFYRSGTGVAQDFAKAVPYLQRGAEQTPPGSEMNTLAMEQLSEVQERNAIPPPPPGTRVTVVLLASAAAALKYNSRKGIVVLLPEEQPAVKVGRAAVLLEGEAKPISFKLMNLRIDFLFSIFV